MRYEQNCDVAVEQTSMRGLGDGIGMGAVHRAGRCSRGWRCWVAGAGKLAVLQQIRGDGWEGRCDVFPSALGYWRSVTERERAQVPWIGLSCEIAKKAGLLRMVLHA